jgi:hypothetical protein
MFFPPTYPNVFAFEAGNRVIIIILFFLPYQLIMSKHKYYVIKHHLFHDLFLHYITLWNLIILWRHK